MSEHAHGPSYKDYIVVFSGLIVLTTMTILISYTGLSESMKMFVAFAIASVKVLLVALIFMHLRYEKSTIVIFAVTPILLAVLFILAISPDVGVAQ